MVDIFLMQVTPETSFEWLFFLAKKYSKMFIQGTWTTLYIAVLGTLFGFALGYLPEMANTFLTNLKMTSVLNVIAVQELFMAAKTVGGNYYKYFEAYLVIAVIYFVLCFIFNRIFIFLEKKMQGRNDYVLAVEYMEDKQ